MSNLLEQWNEHIIKGNQLSRELEDFEGIMHVGDMPDSKIALFGGAGTTFVDRVLSPEKMSELKRALWEALTEAKLTKEVELEKLMGKKPAYINPTFEAAVQVMEQSAKAKNLSSIMDKPESDPVEEKLQEILQTEAKKIEQPEENSLNRYPASKVSKKKYPDGMTIESVTRMYIKEGLPSSSIANIFGISTKEVQNFITINKIRRNQKKPAETERP